MAFSSQGRSQPSASLQKNSPGIQSPRHNPFTSHAHSKSLPTRTQPIQTKALPPARPSLDNAVSATYTGYPDYTQPFAYSLSASSSSSSLDSLYESQASTKASTATKTTITSIPNPNSQIREHKPSISVQEVKPGYRTPGTSTPDAFVPSLSSSTSSVTSEEEKERDDDDYSILDYYSRDFGAPQEKCDPMDAKLNAPSTIPKVDHDNWGGFSVPLEASVQKLQISKLTPTPTTIQNQPRGRETVRKSNPSSAIRRPSQLSREREREVLKSQYQHTHDSLRDIERRKSERSREREEWNGVRIIPHAPTPEMNDYFGNAGVGSDGMGFAGMGRGSVHNRVGGRIEVTNPNFRFRGLEERKGKGKGKGKGSGNGEKKERLDWMMRRWL